MSGVHRIKSLPLTYLPDEVMSTRTHQLRHSRSSKAHALGGIHIDVQKVLHLYFPEKEPTPPLPSPKKTRMARRKPFPGYPSPQAHLRLRVHDLPHLIRPIHDLNQWIKTVRPAVLHYIANKLNALLAWDDREQTYVFYRPAPPSSAHQQRKQNTCDVLCRRLDHTLSRWWHLYAQNKGSSKSMPHKGPEKVSKSVHRTANHSYTGLIPGGGLPDLRGLSPEDRIILLLALFAQEMMNRLEKKVQTLGAGGESETQKQAEIQLLTQKLTRAIQTLSQIMKAFHDTMSLSIQNIR